MVFGEKSFVAFLADKVSASLMRVHVFLQVVGLEEGFVALWALYPSFTVVEKGKEYEEEVSVIRDTALHTTLSEKQVLNLIVC